jgi:hypothetical protein
LFVVSSDDSQQQFTLLKGGLYGDCADHHSSIVRPWNTGLSLL